mmetsp:Transcript_16973/g.20859  ORF Transcript_16973/g.20859 Transcript_16973/m.20859 type:complete len:199 (-) Transcript_16973:8-604(-)
MENNTTIKSNNNGDIVIVTNAKSNFCKLHNTRNFCFPTICGAILMFVLLIGLCVACTQFVIDIKYKNGSTIEECVVDSNEYRSCVYNCDCRSGDTDCSCFGFQLCAVMTVPNKCENTQFQSTGNPYFGCGKCDTDIPYFNQGDTFQCYALSCEIGKFRVTNPETSIYKSRRAVWITTCIMVAVFVIFYLIGLCGLCQC